MESMLAVLAVAAVTHCQARSVGPGSLHRGGTAGATCLSAAFQNGCKPADYTLSAFGIDTVHSETFRVERKNGRCVVAIVETFRVIPQPPRVTKHSTCTRVHRLNGDVVADRCTPKRTFSLTKLTS